MMDKNKLNSSCFIICANHFDLFSESFHKGTVYGLVQGEGQELSIKSLDPDKPLSFGLIIVEANGQPTEFFYNFKHYFKFGTIP